MLMWVTWGKWLRCIHLLVDDGCKFPKRLERPEMLCELSSLVTVATDHGLKALVGLMVKCSCLEVPGCSSLTTRCEDYGHQGCCCPLGTT